MTIASRLDRIEAELENIRTMITDRDSLMDLSGAWSDYETEDGESLEEVKQSIYRRREGSSRIFN